MAEDDNGHEQRMMYPLREGDSVISVCSMVGGKLLYQQRTFTRTEMESACAYNEIAHTVSRMLSQLLHARTDANRG